MNDLDINFLKDLPIFTNLKIATLQQMILVSSIQTYKADEPIFFDKEILSSIHFVLDGSTCLYKTHANGQNKIIFILSKGELLNESVSDELPSAINCKAYSDTVLLSISKKDYLKLMQTDPELMENTINAFSKRIRRLYRQLKNSTSVIKMEKKLAAKLWKLSRDYGVPCDQGVLIDFPITITSLADFLGSYRETISRALKILIRKDLVLYQNKYMIIPDPDKLSSYFKSSH